jgi:hypothetical protein
MADWHLQAWLPWATLRDWFAARFRPETFRQRLILDTEGPVSRLGQEADVRGVHREVLPPQYHMDATQGWTSLSQAEHADWARSQDGAWDVELRTVERLQQAGETGRITVLTPNGALAFVVDLAANQAPSQDAPGSLLEEATALRERLEALVRDLEPQGQSRHRGQEMGR